MRNDIGGIWEKFIVIERLKSTTYTGFYGRRYFWRTYQGQEVDFIEEIEGQLLGVEVKWSTAKKVKAPSAWLQGYPNASFKVITPENYLDYVLIKSQYKKN
jgi:predicted AAA+ superfamily ATPase